MQRFPPCVSRPCVTPPPSCLRVSPPPPPPRVHVSPPCPCVRCDCNQYVDPAEICDRACQSDTMPTTQTHVNADGELVVVMKDPKTGQEVAQVPQGPPQGPHRSQGHLQGRCARSGFGRTNRCLFIFKINNSYS